MTGMSAKRDHDFDRSAADAFGMRMVAALNGASLAIATSVGHQLGLFDAMSAIAQGTSHEVAAAAGLQERYVREWLGAMVTSGVVAYKAVDQTYRLPAEHAASLTRAAGPANLASIMQFVPLMAGVESDILACFRAGGGVLYSRYATFHRVMAEESASTHDATLIEAVLPLVDGLVDRLRQGIDMADIGCGSGHAVNLMAAAFPRSRFLGLDFSQEGIGAGRHEAKRLGLANATFERRDVSRLRRRAAFDLVTAFDAIHDQARPEAVLAGIADAIRPGGVFLMGDIQASSNLERNLEHPLGPFLYAVSMMHCIPVSLALHGAGLGTTWGEEKAQHMLVDAGFTRIEVKHLDGDPLNTYYVARKDAAVRS
jgi:2-polyprenyl-3-methyl-5-hydroxy-6-metoxy-1,4-benzoquinol methylase